MKPFTNNNKKMNNRRLSTIMSIFLFLFSQSVDGSTTIINKKKNGNTFLLSDDVKIVNDKQLLLIETPNNNVEQQQQQHDHHRDLQVIQDNLIGFDFSNSDLGDVSANHSYTVSSDLITGTLEVISSNSFNGAGVAWENTRVMEMRYAPYNYPELQFTTTQTSHCVVESLSSLEFRHLHNHNFPSTSPSYDVQVLFDTGSGYQIIHTFTATQANNGNNLLIPLSTDLSPILTYKIKWIVVPNPGHTTTGSDFFALDDIVLAGTVSCTEWSISNATSVSVVFDDTKDDEEINMVYSISDKEYTYTLMPYNCNVNNYCIGTNLPTPQNNCPFSINDITEIGNNVDGFINLLYKININQSSITNYNEYYTTIENSTNSTINFCIRTDLWLDDGSSDTTIRNQSITFKETTVSIGLNMEGNFIVNDIDTTRDDAENVDKDTSVSYDVIAYTCDEKNGTATTPTISNNNNKAKVCVKVNEDDTTTDSDVYVSDIIEFICSQDDTNIEAEYISNSIDDDLATADCTGGNCYIEFMVASRFFLNTNNPGNITCNGVSLLAFGTSRRVLVDIYYGGRDEEDNKLSFGLSIPIEVNHDIDETMKVIDDDVKITTPNGMSSSANAGAIKTTATTNFTISIVGTITLLLMFGLF